MNHSMIFLSALCTVYCLLTQVDGKGKSGADVFDVLKNLEAIKDCLKSSKDLREDPNNAEKMIAFSTTCEQFLKELDLSENHRSILNKIGHLKKKPEVEHTKPKQDVSGSKVVTINKQENNVNKLVEEGIPKAPTVEERHAAPTNHLPISEPKVQVLNQINPPELFSEHADNYQHNGFQMQPGAEVNVKQTILPPKENVYTEPLVVDFQPDILSLFPENNVNLDQIYNEQLYQTQNTFSDPLLGHDPNPNLLSPPQDHFGQHQGHFQQQYGHFEQQQGNFEQQQGNFEQQLNNFEEQQGHFQQPQGHFQQPQGHFQRPEDNFQQPQVQFQHPQGQFQHPQGQFQHPQGQFQQPQDNFQQPLGHIQQPQGHFQQQLGNFEQLQGHFDQQHWPENLNAFFSQPADYAFPSIHSQQNADPIPLEGIKGDEIIPRSETRHLDDYSESTRKNQVNTPEQHYMGNDGVIPGHRLDEL